MMVVDIYERRFPENSGGVMSEGINVTQVLRDWRDPIESMIKDAMENYGLSRVEAAGMFSNIFNHLKKSHG